MSKGTLVMMHGMTGTSEKMENLARSLTPEGWSTLCPQAKIRHPTRGGFAWWLFEDGVSKDESLSQMEESISAILEILPDGPIIVGGFSQGGAMALHCGCELPLAGVMSCSGYPHPDWQPASNHPPVLLVHGTEDTIVPVAAMDAIWSRLQTERCEKQVFHQGHTIPSELMGTFQQTLRRMLPAEMC